MLHTWGQNLSQHLPPPEDAPLESVVDLLQRLTGVDLARCPVCSLGRMQSTAIVMRVALWPDTS
jgi:hypothetical protein